MPRRIELRGAAEILNKLRALGEQFPQAAGNALYRFAETEVVAPAKADYVPVMTGNLRASIRAEQPVITGNRITVTVGAGGSAAPYARKVHENPRSGRTGGVSPQGKRYKQFARVGQWKYLETPAMEARRKMGALAREAGAELDQVIRGIR